MTFYLPPFVALVLIYLFFYYVVYPAIISPLSKIPSGHPIASFLPIWIWWKRRKGYESRSIFAAHQRHGPVVRLAPNEVSVVSLEGLRKIYIGGFERTEWFLQFRNYDGTPNLVTMLNAKEHATRRRIVSHIYSKSYLLGSSDFQKLSHILLFERLLPVLDNAARAGKGINMYSLGCAAGAEFMTAYGLGSTFGLDLMRRGREDERTLYLETGKRKLMNLKGGECAAKELEEQLLQMCREAERYLKSNSSAPKDGKGVEDEKDGKARQIGSEDAESTSTYPIVYDQLINSIPTKEHVANPQETILLAASELLDNTEAARVGIGITLTYAMHELSQRLALQSNLRKELTTAELPLTYPLQHQLLSTSILRKLDVLPLLDAVITETLRLHPSAPGPQRRFVPKGGTIIDGYFIPAGATISSAPYCLHRYKDVYPEAELWKPERWIGTADSMNEQPTILDEGGEGLENGKVEHDPRRWFWAFGSGGRMCVGNHFALVGKFGSLSCETCTTRLTRFIVLKLLLASIYMNYTTTVIDDEGIEHIDDVIAAPVGDKLILGFSCVPMG
jgi:Cytochrome P450